MSRVSPVVILCLLGVAAGVATAATGAVSQAGVNSDLQALKLAQNGPGPAQCTPPPISLGLIPNGPTEWAAAKWQNNTWLQWNFTSVAANTCVQIKATFIDATSIPNPPAGAKQDVNLWACTAEGCPADACTLASETDIIIGPEPLPPGQALTTFAVSAGPAYVGIKALSSTYSDFNVTLEMEQVLCGNPAGCSPTPFPIEIPSGGQDSTTLTVRNQVNNTWVIYKYDASKDTPCVSVDAVWSAPTKIGHTGTELIDLWVCSSGKCPTAVCARQDDADLRISAKAPNAGAITPVAAPAGTAYFGIFLTSSNFPNITYNVTLRQVTCPSVLPTASPSPGASPSASSSPVPIDPNDDCSFFDNGPDCVTQDDCWWCTGPANECVNATVKAHIGAGESCTRTIAAPKKKKCGGGCAAGIIFGLFAAVGAGAGAFWWYRKKKSFEMKNFEPGHTSSSGAYSTFN